MLKPHLLFNFEGLEFLPFHPDYLPLLPEFQPEGWGDLAPRFSFFLENEYCLPAVLRVNKEIVAIGTSILHTDSAWLATIIVHPQFRGKGYGQFITQKLVDSLDPKKYSSIMLDATDLGYPVYHKLGFELHTRYVHFSRPALIATDFEDNSVPFEEKYLSTLLAFDRELSGEDRIYSFKPHLAQARLVFEDQELTGCYFPTWGEGHIWARNERVGKMLMNLRFATKNIAAVPEESTLAQEYLQQNGFAYIRHSRRMFLRQKRTVNFKNMYNRVSGMLG